MPNECRNKIVIDGDKAAIERMLIIISSGGNGYFDFNTVLPYPEKYARLDKQAEIEEEKGNYDFKSGFDSGGFEWRIKHWGTKWNSIDAYFYYSSSIDKTEEELPSITFTTAWSPSLPVTKAMSAMFPDLTLIHWYAEENMDFSGYCKFMKGKIVEKKDGSYEDFPFDSICHS